MNRLRIIKIALLIVILAEEIRSAKKIKKFTPEDSKGFPDITKDSIKEPK
ncbi:hypothetical protein P563_02323 [Staphylococcus aureus M1423]|jgi:hypothetical protein|uniref:Uncharacterized protein n=9 Tax=root TaxID=1 RepID=A1KX02_9CAUD|nr:MULTISPECIES: hypothetical protein [Bacilli]NP_075483.1 hypothetical protein phiSLTp20 [Staphylococcus phage phiSLT]YP_001004280.1 hypothetical protein phiETA2_gp20 [Staphylococcus phage phiETA2]YP_001004348.1 hypothetical protein phiETA3_gp19 [Staphylococcus phage phiETA3]YP_001429980.1 hypothetical protein SPTP3103_p18 [Staphylococcus phage tp310-3]YP_009103440.1 hypothetical protein PI31_gp21 [Staphylococcus phage phiSa119]YP_009830283.1 hypothetical protein HWA91_gp48 [Staphylococcus p